MKRFGVLLGLALTLAAAGAAPAQAGRPLTLGFYDSHFGPGSDSVRAAWLDSSVSVGAQIVRLGFDWRSIAPSSRPAGFNAADAADAAYSWTGLDAAVRDATARGLHVLLNPTVAPSWAEGSGRPESATPGSWRPDPAALGAFARACAQRYSGAFPDPLRPGFALPRVRFWQPWNEPNLKTYLAPQWERRGERLVPASPAWYRRMLNAFAVEVKGVNSANFVVTAGTAPFGDPEAGGSRIKPLVFWRLLLGSGRTRLDAISHHPYGVGGPTRHAIDPRDIAVGDVGSLVKVLRRAEKRRRVLPRKRKRVWVTELGWDTRPPDPSGYPAETQARWAAQALYILWHAGVDTVTWYQVRDDPPIPSFAATFQSGVFLNDGRPKPAAAAFRFPFVAKRIKPGRLQVWGRAPAPGDVVIERQQSGWVPVATLKSGTSHIFRSTIAARGQVTLRARVGAAVSPSWTARG